MAIGDSAPAPLIARYSAPVAALAAAAALVAPRFSLLQEAEARLPLSAFPAVPPAVLIAACALREELQLDFFAKARAGSATSRHRTSAAVWNLRRSYFFNDSNVLREAMEIYGDDYAALGIPRPDWLGS